MVASENARGLRAFALGGPEGAAFNVRFLECALHVALPCSGDAELRLLVGNRLVSKLALPHAAGHARCRLGLTAKDWEREVDSDRDLAYDTAILRAEVQQTCGDPPYAEHVRTAFVAGFASGE
jgi:hypothetical protein